MKTLKVRNLFYFAVTALFVSCSDVDKKDVDFSSLDYLSENDDAIDSRYMDIVNGVCEETGPAKYTLDNSAYFILSEQQDLSCFVFSSDLTCGNTDDLFGWNIGVYRNINDRYQVIYNARGEDLRVSVESIGGFRSFLYFDSLGEKVRVSWNGNEFKEKKLPVTTLNKKHAEKLGEFLNQDPSVFCLESDPKGVENIVLSVDEMQIGENRFATVYSTAILPSGINYFVFDKEDLIYHGENLLAIEAVKDKSKNYFDFKITDINSEFNTRKNAYIPFFCEYSAKQKKYVVKSDPV